MILLAKKLPDTPINLLSGTAVKTEKGFFYIKNGVRLRIPSNKIAKSWEFPRIVRHSEAALVNYPVTGLLGFRDGSLLWCISNARYYVISNSKAFHVDDPQTLKNHGIRFTDAFIVGKKELSYHKVVEHD